MTASFHRLLLLLPAITHPSSHCNALSKPSSRTYNYFAYGSNMLSSTMIHLRNLTPLSSSAAVLPHHTLRFNIPGIPGLEPSSASVEPNDSDVVHGTLYKLSGQDFDTICRTEGVPLVYTLHRCRVIPYDGDGRNSGETRRRRTMESHDEEIRWGVPAFTLRAAREEWRDPSKDIDPSQSYLNVLIRGAEEYRLDQEYVDRLKRIRAGKTWLGGGLAEEWLRWAEGRSRSGRSTILL